MKFQDDISNMNTHKHTHTHTDKLKPICPPLFQSWGHKKHVYKAIRCNCTFNQLEYNLCPMKNMEPKSSSQAQPNVVSIESHLVIKPITWLWVSTDPILTLFLYLCVPLSLFTVRLPCPYCPLTHSFYTFCFILRLDAFVLPTSQNEVFRIHVHSHYCSKIL